MENLVNSLMIAVINPNYHGRKVFATFFVEEQQEDVLKVLPLWCEDYPDNPCGQMDGMNNSVRQLKIEDIWVFPTTISDAKKEAFSKMGLDYRFYKDDKALERFASKLDMDKINVGYEGEPEDGTWFTCCRIDLAAVGILPENFYFYSLRASELDDSQPASIEERVIINHYGDILTDKPLPVPVELEVEPVEYDDEGCIVN